MRRSGFGVCSILPSVSFGFIIQSSQFPALDSQSPEPRRPLEVAGRQQPGHGSPTKRFVLQDMWFSCSSLEHDLGKVQAACSCTIKLPRRLEGGPSPWREDSPNPFSAEKELRRRDSTPKLEHPHFVAEEIHGFAVQGLRSTLEWFLYDGQSQVSQYQI